MQRQIAGYRAVDTNQFWELMKSPGFVRLDYNNGALFNEKYYCAIPPEEIDGFMADRAGEALKMLGVGGNPYLCPFIVICGVAAFIILASVFIWGWIK